MPIFTFPILSQWQLTTNCHSNQSSSPTGTKNAIIRSPTYRYAICEIWYSRISFREDIDWKCWRTTDVYFIEHKVNMMPFRHYLYFVCAHCVHTPMTLRKMNLFLKYSPRARADNPWGQNFDVNRKALSLCSFFASFKKISLKSDFIYTLKSAQPVHFCDMFFTGGVNMKNSNLDALFCQI